MPLTYQDFLDSIVPAGRLVSAQRSISPVWVPKVGDAVVINTTAIPELLGDDAVVTSVLRGKKRIHIRTVKAPIREFQCGVGAVLPKPSNIAPSFGEGIPPGKRLPMRNGVIDSSNPLINTALSYGRNLVFDYTDLDGNFTHRDVEPHYVFQARGTGNELLLSRDYVLRGGDWRCFRPEAMRNTAVGGYYSENYENTYSDVDKGVKDRLMKLSSRFPDRGELLVHMNKDDLLGGLSDYRDYLYDYKLPHDVVLPRRKRSHILNVQFQPNIKRKD